MKRTSCNENKKYKSELEIILRNISYEEKGNFSYYQGLNYLTNYFLLVFEGDSLITYNFVLFLMKNYFEEYLKNDFQRLDLLNYLIKKLIKIYLPKVHNFFERLKINLDIYLSSWCLTLFTSILHSESENRILNDIIDIFVSKQWEGFFRILIVLIEEAQSQLFEMEQDEILLFLSEINKKGFRIIKSINDDPHFSLKQKIKKYQLID